MTQSYNEEQSDGADPLGLNAPSTEGWSAIDFWTTCGSNGIAVSIDEMGTLQRYHDELLYWNGKVNMVSRQDESHLWDRHILHSLTLLKYIDFPKKARVLDVGTGGGLPGIPIKIMRPDIKMTLADSIRKKMNLTHMFAQHTQLKDVEAVNIRVEDLATNEHYQKGLDVIIARGVAQVSQLVEWTKPLLKPTGFWALLKGGDLTEEIATARKSNKELTFDVIDIDMFGAPWFKENNKCIVTVRRSS